MNGNSEKIEQAGYFKNFSGFEEEDIDQILDKLKVYIPDAETSQVIAWKDSIEVLKALVSSLQDPFKSLPNHSIILEYKIPWEQRRIDALLLLADTAIVLEFKGKDTPTRADMDQAISYARDLANYHSQCSNIHLRCCLVLTKAKRFFKKEEDLEIVSPSELKKLCETLVKDSDRNKAINLDDFLSISAYKPLPSLIKAARELFQSGDLTRIHRSASETKPAVETCFQIIQETFLAKRRALILVNGAPGAGKTLVGLKLAYEDYIKKLALENDNFSNPISVFLSGPGPLSEVLQYELGKSEGDGKVFVKKLYDYVSTFAKNNSPRPSNNIMIYDEAQRAWDSDQVSSRPHSLGDEFKNLSEPEILIKLAERVADWCVVVCLIGNGQEIHTGEEGGLVLWKEAIEKSETKSNWDIYVPNTDTIFQNFHDLDNLNKKECLYLKETIRFHTSQFLIEFVKRLLSLDSQGAYEMSIKLEKSGYHLRMTHQFEKARRYISDRYQGNREARYGIVCSAKDKDLDKHLGGIEKGYGKAGEIRKGMYGQWFSNGKGKDLSCCNLDKVTTEFGVQGLELDFSLLAWGTDLIIDANKWSNKYAAGYAERSKIKDPLNLRINAYRVLLTRGREGMVVFVPPISDKARPLYAHLKRSGFKEL